MTPRKWQEQGQRSDWGKVTRSREERLGKGLWCPVSETESQMRTWKRGSEKERIYPSDWNAARLGQKLFLNRNTSLLILTYKKVCIKN